MAFRLDIGQLRPPRRLPDGRLIADGLLTRAGVFVYRDHAGKEFREWRPESEVFRSESLSTFAQVPITDDHPAENLSADNARVHAVGATGESIVRDGIHVRASVMVFDAATIAKMDAGKTALSCGYEADVEITPGTSPEGERYDAIQRNIRGNHVAIVDVARAGSQARVRMDAMVQIPTPPEERHDTMDPKLLEAIEKATAATIRADAAEKTLATTKTDLDAMTAKLAAVTAEVTALKQAHQDAISGEPARIRARVALEGVAVRVLDEADRGKIPTLTDREIKVAVVKKIDSLDLAADKSDVYVDAYFDSASKRADAADASLEAGRRGGGSEPPRSTEAQARQDMIERNRKLGTATA